MGRSPAPIVAHRLSLAEQRVLASFLSGRLPAGQVDAQLARARQPDLAQPALQPPPLAPAQPKPVVVPAVAA